MNTINVYKAAFVRIWDETGEAILGAGALATPEGLVLTCAHVVGERDTVRLDFPLLAPRRFFTARVVRRDPEADLAALRLEGEPPTQARPMPFALAEDVWQHPFRTCGFPRGYDEGVWAKGVLLAPTGDRGWVQMEAERTTGFAVQRGFSGAPVWDDRLNAAVGLVVTAAGERETRAAFCIPVAQLVAFWPDLDKHARPPNPYRGLLPFREEDAANFFGREKLSEELAERVRRDSLTVVLGASGSGKSSLVQAGLIPRIRALPGWAIVLVRPGDKPFHELARGLLHLLEPDLTEVDRLTKANKLAHTLATGEVTLDDVVRRILEKQAGEHFLLVVDQFEELFTLVTDRAVRRRYLDMLLDAGEKPRTPLHLVLVMRMDFLAESRRLDQSLREHHFLVTSMSDEELRRAIVEPARRAHVTFEPGLVERILEDVGDEPGRLPFLEFALQELWTKEEEEKEKKLQIRWVTQLSHAAYEAIGGVEGALERHAEKVYETLAKQGYREEVRRIFVQLVEFGEGTVGTRRRAYRSQLGEARWALVQRLASERLVVTNRDAEGREYVEVAHEALIRHWPRLREWMREDREFRRWQERTRAQAARWCEQGRPTGLLLQGRWLDEALDWLEKREAEIEDTLTEYIRASQEERERRRAEEERRRRRTLSIVTGAAVFFLLLALLAGWQWRLAVQRQRVALARQLVITGQTLLQEAPYDNAPTAALLGAEAVRLSPSYEAYALLNDALDHLPRRVLGWHEHEAGVNTVAFSPDGKWVVSGSDDGTAVVWEAATGRQVARFEHGDDVTAVAFSPDGKWVVSGSADGTAVVWEAATGREVARFVHGDAVTAVAFSPDGQWVVSGGCEERKEGWCTKGAAVVWWVGLRIEEEICLHISANLTLAAWQRYVGDLPYHPTCPNLPIPEDVQEAIQAYQARLQRRAFWAAVAGTLILGLALAGFGRQRASLFAGFMGVAVSAIAGVAIWQAVNAWMYSTSLVQDALLGIGMVVSAGWLLWPWKIRLQRRHYWITATWLVLFAYALLVYALTAAYGHLPPLPGARTVWRGWAWLLKAIFILKELPLSPRQWILLGLTWLWAGLLVTLSALALDYVLFALYRRVRPRLEA